MKALDDIVKEAAEELLYAELKSHAVSEAIIRAAIDEALEQVVPMVVERCADRCQQHKARMFEICDWPAGHCAALLEHTIRAMQAALLTEFSRCVLPIVSNKIRIAPDDI